MAKKKHMTRDELLIRKGKIQGTKENMDMVAMVLLDKFGFHIQEETEDEHDTKSLSYLYNCIVELVQEVNDGRIRRRHIEDVLSEEYGVKNVDEAVQQCKAELYETFGIDEDGGTDNG